MALLAMITDQCTHHTTHPCFFSFLWLRTRISLLHAASLECTEHVWRTPHRENHNKPRPNAAADGPADSPEAARWFCTTFAKIVCASSACNSAAPQPTPPAGAQMHASCKKGTLPVVPVIRAYAADHAPKVTCTEVQRCDPSNLSA